MSNDLEAILSGNDSDESEVVEESQSRDEHGKFVSAGAAEVVEEEPTGEEPAEEAADVSPATVDAKIGNEDKVAAMAAELARIRAKNRELDERSNRKVDQPPPDLVEFFDDPDRALSMVEQRMEAKLQRKIIDMSEYNARQRHEDFDEKIEVFTEIASENPVLWQQMAMAPDPAEFAYKQANQVSKMREFGDLDKFEAKIRAEERTRTEAEFAKKYEDKLSELTKLPGSLSDKRAAGGNSSKVVINESLEDIFGR